MVKVGGDTMRRKVFATVLSLIFGLLMIPFSAHAQFYTWKDDKGGVHFTDEYFNIPENYRQVAKAQWFPKESSPPSVKEIPTPVLTPKSLKSFEEETPRIFRGMISRVDPVAKMIVVTGEEGEMVFPVAEDARIKTDAGNNVPLAKLGSGMEVSVEYVKKGNDNYARSITVSILEAGTPNAVESNQGGPGQIQNPGEIQKRVWENQKAHKLPKLTKK
jgi:hypothetical protein